MMKKILFLTGGLALCAAVFAQQRLPLDKALTAAASYLCERLPRNTRVLALKLGAPSEALSDYASDLFTARLLASGAFTLVERDSGVLQGIERESAYQLSGNVDDASMAFIGHQAGAQALVLGVIARAGSEYRLRVRAAGIENAEVLGVYMAALESTEELRKMAAARSGVRPVRPEWITRPLEGGRARYEQGSPSGVSLWYYDVGMSAKTSTEQRARQRASQNVQANIAATIASDFKARLDITEYSLFQDCGLEDAERLIETAISSSIKTRIPRYEPLEWHIETGVNGEGREWYTAYLLVRFPRKDILDVVERIEPAATAASLISNAVKQKLIDPPRSGAGEEEMLEGLTAAREYALESIEAGLTGN
ncbi:MAG: CsgG/HfaB family protein [Treponema sp.]|nr:CsgG/HfaB family protein [Treponema sp.]